MLSDTERDSQLFSFLTRRSQWETAKTGPAIIKMQHQVFKKVEYITLTMRMALDGVTAPEFYKAGFHLTRAWLNQDENMVFEFMRWKEPWSYENP